VPEGDGLRALQVCVYPGITAFALALATVRMELISAIDEPHCFCASFFKYAAGRAPPGRFCCGRYGASFPRRQCG
jgi:hypothetical protein